MCGINLLLVSVILQYHGLANRWMQYQKDLHWRKGIAFWTCIFYENLSEKKLLKLLLKIRFCIKKLYTLAFLIVKSYIIF